jgi:hypothetical protein
MIRKLFILFSLGIFSISIYGQDSLTYKSKWQTRLLFGTNIPMTRLLQGAETDYLFQYDDNSMYWQILSISYFFHKHWGLEFNYQAGTSSRIRQRGENFITTMQSMYGDKYYENPSTGAIYNNGFFEGDISRGYLGVIYRFETNKFYVYPKLAIGVISFNTDWGRIDLKEKNSNIEYKINYSSKKITNDHFTLAPSVSLGYKIAKRFYFNADIMFSYYKTNIVYEKTTTNLYTSKRTVELFDYKKGISTLSLGAGLIFIIH